MAKSATKTPAAPASNLFTRAKSAPSNGAAKKDEKEVVETSNLDIYAQIDALEKTLETLKKTARGELLGPTYDKFARNKGETYTAKDKNSTATVICSKRSSLSGLKPEELKLCEDYHIPVKHLDGDFKFNAEVINEKILAKVSAAIESCDLSDEIKQNLIIFDASKARTIVTEESLEAVFKMNDHDSIVELLPVVSTVMYKAKTTSRTPIVLANVAKEVLDTEAEVAEMVKAVTAK